jgi:2-keto-4-pentenoate hydratase/2-oxohepta-3-ene-1,7-dioic acid hydratase in catechol pathway
MGPWIETDFDLEKAETIVKVNGEVADHFRTNNMIHGVAKFLSRMSQYLTLYPGDVVWMGTEGSPRNLKHGDVCEIEITGIGILRNGARKSIGAKAAGLTSADAVLLPVSTGEAGGSGRFG